MMTRRVLRTVFVGLMVYTMAVFPLVRSWATGAIVFPDISAGLCSAAGAAPQQPDAPVHDCAAACLAADHGASGLSEKPFRVSKLHLTEAFRIALPSVTAIVSARPGAMLPRGPPLLV